jgi:hypothetical protein
MAAHPDLAAQFRMNGRLVPAPWRSFIVKVLVPEHFGQVSAGRRLRALSAYETLTLTSYMVEVEGTVGFAPRAQLLRWLGLDAALVLELQARHPCHRPGLCAVREGYCPVCARVVESIGADWNLLEGLTLLHHWVRHVLAGVSARSGGHSSPIHVCGASCPHTRENPVRESRTDVKTVWAEDGMDVSPDSHARGTRGAGRSTSRRGTGFGAAQLRPRSPRRHM